MPEDTGQASKPEEPKPEPKSPSEVQGNEGKARGKSRYVNYQDLDKSELVSMLLRINKRLTRVNKELKEIINILYYGTQAPQSEGQGNQGYRNYRRNYGYSKYGGRYGNRQYGYKGSYGRQRRSEDEDVNYD